MFDFFKAMKETAAARAVSISIQQTNEKAVSVKSRKKTLTASRIYHTRPEQLYLRREIQKSQKAIDAARNHFEEAVDPTLIDCYIYELNAAQLRYQFLLRKFKSQEE